MVQKGQHPIFMCGIFCCILIFISGTTHMIAVPFITAVIGYGAGALVCRSSRKQQLWCAAVSAVFTAAVLPISGIHRLLLQSQSTQVSRWGVPQYLFLLAVAALSVFRGLRADFFWSKSWGTFFFSYPFVSGVCLGCLAQTAEAAKAQ